MSTEVITRLEGKIDALTEVTTKLRIDFAEMRQAVNGGVGKSPECLEHRADISNIKGQLRLYAGAMVIVIPLINYIGPVVIKHIFP